MNAVVGIFVGGSGSRLGGVAKGLLTAPGSDQTLLARLLTVCERALPGVRPVLVGPALAYAHFGLTELADDPPNIGPLGGLRALLKFAEGERAPRALALACDLPFLDERAILRLNLPLAQAARVPFAEGQWQPLAAAYEPRKTISAIERVLARDQRALMRVLAELGDDVEQLPADADLTHALRDWDTPEDLLR